MAAKRQPVSRSLHRFLAAVEHRRVRGHLRKVERQLRAKHNHRGVAERTQRAINLDRLHDYWIRGRFPLNIALSKRSPVFRDEMGTTCAVAYLIEESGLTDVVDEVARTNNHVLIEALEAGPVVDWIDRSGLTKVEAARIQPSYCHMDPPVMCAVPPAFPEGAISLLPMILAGVGAIITAWVVYRTGFLTSLVRHGRNSLSRRRAASLPHAPEATWILDYGDPDDDAVAISPHAFARIDLCKDGFILIDEDEVQSVGDRPWPRVPGNQVIWAVGAGESDISPVALVIPDRAGDTSFYELVKGKRTLPAADFAIATSDVAWGAAK